MTRQHIVESLATHAVYFVGGPWVEIDPPTDLQVGDEVEVSVSGVSRLSIEWMKWNDKERKQHLIHYDINGNPVEPWTPASIIQAGLRHAGLSNIIEARRAKRER